jgi:hypothetical protein
MPNLSDGDPPGAWRQPSPQSSESASGGFRCRCIAALGISLTLPWRPELPSVPARQAVQVTRRKGDDLGARRPGDLRVSRSSERVDRELRAGRGRCPMASRRGRSAAM